jgi:hypothetical protein
LGHEAIISGRIKGATWRTENFRSLQVHNARVLEALPLDDEWPWLVRGMFSLPATEPQGAYRSQIIHFGASIKDDPHDPDSWPRVWFEKFERLLSSLYWFSASVLLEREFGSDQLFRWRPTSAAVERMCQEPPQCISEWERSVTSL